MNEIAMEIPVREAPMHDVELIPRRVLGAPATRPIGRRMSIGEPLLLPLAKPSADSEALRHFLSRAGRTHDFSELHLVVTLYPDDDQPFLDMAVGVSLRSDGTAEPPIAWSLHPERQETAYKASTKLGLDAQLGFIKPGITAERERNVAESLVIGLGERESAFEWRFSRTRTTGLAGIYRMVAIIRGVKGAALEADILASATVRRSKLGVPLRAALPEMVRHVRLAGDPPNG